MSKRAPLIICDGWGIDDKGKDGAIFDTLAPYWDELLKTYPAPQLQASGEDADLPDGQMGNSEVDHLNIGVGRIVYQDSAEINIACRENTIIENPEIKRTYSYAKENNKQIHFTGLASGGGVHGPLERLLKLTDIAREYGISKAYVHCFMDGRNTGPKSDRGLIETLEDHPRTTGGKIASIIGRYYAMNRGKRWEHVRETYGLLVEDKGKQAECTVKAMEESYAGGVADEFIKSIVRVENEKPVAIIEKGDVVIFFNYRNNRAKGLTVVLIQQDTPEADMYAIPGLQHSCITPYDASFKGIHILFDKENVSNTLGRLLANVGKVQLYIAEVEKYAHVTLFFNGSRGTPFDSKGRILVPSSKVATYDLKPEMNAFEVRDKLADAIITRKLDFIVVNYVNDDMIGHTGIYKAVEKAVATIDACLHDTVEAVKANDYEVAIVADHGNADHTSNRDGTPNAVCSLNPVLFVYVTTNKGARIEDGILADVTPSIPHILGSKQPKGMTGKLLVKQELGASYDPDR